MSVIPLPPRSDKPFYKSLAQSIRDSIEAGRLKAGESLPPQHEIARAARVNVGTVGRAINLLIREQVLTKRSRRERVRVAERAGPEPAAVADERARGALRLEVQVSSIQTFGETAEVHAVVTEHQEVVIPTTSASVGWLDLKAGQRIFVDIASPQLGLSSG